MQAPDPVDFSCVRGIFRLLFHSSIVLFPAVLQVIAGSDNCSAKWGAILFDSGVHTLLVCMAFAVMEEARVRGRSLMLEERVVVSMVLIATVIRIVGVVINHNGWTTYCTDDFMMWLVSIPQTMTVFAVMVVGMIGFVLFLLVAMYVYLVCKVVQITKPRLSSAATIGLMVVRVFIGLAVIVWSMWAGLTHKVNDGGGMLVLHVIDMAVQLGVEGLLVGQEGEGTQSVEFTTNMLVLLTVAPIVKAVGTHLFYYDFDRHWLCTPVLFPYMVGTTLVGLAIIVYHIVRFEGTQHLPHSHSHTQPEAEAESGPHSIP